MAGYSRGAGKDVKSAMHRRKEDSPKRGKDGTVKSKKQVIAKVPKRKTAKKKAAKKKSRR
jgi:hypothetical protein